MRKDLIDEDEVGTYHCARALRAASLPVWSGPCQRQELRALQDWIRNRLEFLAGQFGVDVLGYTIMSNHDSWLETVLHFGRWFHRAAGRADSLAQEASRRGRRWLAGVARSRQAFAYACTRRQHA